MMAFRRRKPSAEKVIEESREAIDVLEGLLETLKGYVVDLQEEVVRQDEKSSDAREA
jgi:hypothetical protein